MTTPRWYMVNEMGMATLCTDQADAEKEAADAQSVWPHMGPHRAVQLVEEASLAASAGSEPVASIYITPAGEREMDDWKVELPPGRNILYTHRSTPGGMVAEQALRKVLSVVQRYLPPDGPTAHDAMTEITEIVDPWPLGPMEKP